MQRGSLTSIQFAYDGHVSKDRQTALWAYKVGFELLATKAIRTSIFCPRLNPGFSREAGRRMPQTARDNDEAVLVFMPRHDPKRPVLECKMGDRCENDRPKYVSASQGLRQHPHRVLQVSLDRVQ